MNCTICGDDIRAWIPPHCWICDHILNALKPLGNTPSRERLHLINNYIAKGVDD